MIQKKKKRNFPKRGVGEAETERKAMEGKRISSKRKRKKDEIIDREISRCSGKIHVQSANNRSGLLTIRNVDEFRGVVPIGMLRRVRRHGKTYASFGNRHV